MLLPFLLAALFLVSTASLSHEEFISQCVRWNYNEVCNLQCFNFTGAVNDFELDDCKGVQTKRYEWEREVLVYPLNASAYLQYFERQMREDLGSRAEIITTEEELLQIEEDYIKNIDDHVNKRKKNIKLKFAVFLRECDSCPQGLDYIAETLRLAKQDYQRLRPSSESSPPAVLLIIIGVVVLCGLAIVVVPSVKFYRKRRADGELPFATDRRKRWVPFPDDKIYYPPVEAAEPAKKKKRGLQQRDMNIQYSVIEQTKRRKLEKDVSQVYSLPMRIPPPPTITPPPILEGVLSDKSTYYQPQLTRQRSALLSDLVSLPGKDKEGYIIMRLEEELRKNPALDINEQETEEDRSTPLIMAVRWSRREVARKLIQLGADVHRFTTNCSTVLHHAVHNQDLPMLKVLLEDRQRFLEKKNGRPAIDALNKLDQTPLMLCAYSVQFGVQMANILIDAGANLADAGEFECAEAMERTALHHAAMQNNVSLLRCLLEAAVEQNKLDKVIDGVDKEHHTALWYACKNANAEAVKVLLEAGADQHVPDHTKEDCPLAMAEQTGNQEVLSLLQESKDKVRTGGSARFIKNRKKPKRRSSGCSSTSEEGTSQDSGLSGSHREEDYDDQMTPSLPSSQPPSFQTGYFFERGASQSIVYSDYGQLV